MAKERDPNAGMPGWQAPAAKHDESPYYDALKNITNNHVFSKGSPEDSRIHALAAALEKYVAQQATHKFTMSNPGEEPTLATGQKFPSDPEAKTRFVMNHNQSLYKNFVNATMANWMQGPVESDSEHKNVKPEDPMDWTVMSAQARVGQVTYSNGKDVSQTTDLHATYLQALDSKIAKPYAQLMEDAAQASQKARAESAVGHKDLAATYQRDQQDAEHKAQLILQGLLRKAEQASTMEPEMKKALQGGAHSENNDKKLQTPSEVIASLPEHQQQPIREQFLAQLNAQREQQTNPPEQAQTQTLERV